MIWFLIALSDLLHAFLTALVVFSVPAAFRVRGTVTVAINVSAICNTAVALWIAGPQARKTTRLSIVTPAYKWTGIAIVLPLAIEVVLFLLQAAIKVLNLGNAAADDIVCDAFYLPHFIGMFLTLVIPAFCEEVLFRGLLQERFIRRYGMYRGVFLVCITWAAFHFYSYFMSPHHSYRDILARLAGRIVMTLGVGLVLSWISLRSGSIVPATLAHALYNALLFAPLLAPVGGVPLLRTTLGRLRPASSFDSGRRPQIRILKSLRQSLRICRLNNHPRSPHRSTPRSVQPNQPGPTYSSFATAWPSDFKSTYAGAGAGAYGLLRNASMFVFHPGPNTFVGASL